LNIALTIILFLTIARFLNFLKKIRIKGAEIDSCGILFDNTKFIGVVVYAAINPYMSNQ